MEVSQTLEQNKQQMMKKDMILHLMQFMKPSQV